MGMFNSEQDIRQIQNYEKNRIRDHYLGIIQSKFKGQAKYPVSSYPPSKKDELDTCCDIWIKDVYKSALPYYDNSPIAIKVCRRKSGDKGGNDHNFRVELLQDLSDIIKNNNPDKDVTYLAFLVENITGGWENEIHVYVLEKSLVLKVAQRLADMGAIKYGKSRKNPGEVSLRVDKNVKDKWGNFLNFYGKNLGVILTNKFIRNYWMDKFALGTGEDSTFKNKQRSGVQLDEGINIDKLFAELRDRFPGDLGEDIIEKLKRNPDILDTFENSFKETDDDLFYTDLD